MILSFLTIVATFLWTQSSLFSTSQHTHWTYVTYCGLASTSHREPSPCFLWLLLFIVQWLSRVWLSATPQTATRQASTVLHCRPELAQIHVHWVCDDIQPSHPLSPPSPSALSLPQHQGLFLMSWLFTSGGQSIEVSWDYYTVWSGSCRLEGVLVTCTERTSMMGWAQEHFIYTELSSEN